MTEQEAKKTKSKRKHKKKKPVENNQASFKAGRVHLSSRTLLPPSGATGLKYRGGMIYDEYLMQLRPWLNAAKMYLQMRDDVLIGTLLSAIKLPILAAGVTVLPADEQSPGDEAAADWLFENLHRMECQSWNSHMEDMLEAIDFGFSIGEVVLEKRKDGRLWIENISPRGQETLYKWDFDDNGRATTFIQRNPNNGEMLEIPLSRCVHVVYNGRAGNPQGRSLLRSLYRPYRMTHDMENMEAIGMEHDIGGMPIAQIKEGIDISSSDRTTLEEGLEAMRVDEAMYLIAPAGVEVKPYQGGTKLFDWSKVIERKKKEMLGRMFAQFLKLGMDKVGTQALVQGTKDFFGLGLKSVQTMLEEAWNDQLVRYLFAFNTFAGMTEYPRIVCNPIGADAIDTMAKTYAQLVGVKAMTPLDEDEDMFREMLSLPTLPEEERGQDREPEAVATPGLFEMQRHIPDQEVIDEERAKAIARRVIEEAQRASL